MRPHETENKAAKAQTKYKAAKRARTAWVRARLQYLFGKAANGGGTAAGAQRQALKSATTPAAA